jgi:hypothetical protein
MTRRSFITNFDFSFRDCTYLIIIRFSKQRRVRLAVHVAHMGEKRNAFRVLVGKLEGKTLLGRRRYSWEDGMKMDCKEIG